MLVSCPKCESRYKLPDDKIRPTGTKVRCPRCQHTFHVFKEEAQAEVPVPSPTTDFGRTEVEKNPAIPKSNAPVHDEADDSAFVEGAKTMVSPPPQRKEVKQKEPSPFKKAKSEEKISVADDDEATEFIDRKIIQPADLMDQVEEEATGPQEQELPPLRPFGDATFAEIQRSGGRAKSKKKWVAIASIFFVFAAAAAYLLKNFQLPQSSKTAPSASAPAPATQQNAAPTTRKNANWYKDETAFYQDFLTQMATLPLSEQQKPENRGFLSEALIANGLMIGADDQVISGMGIASGLIAAYPTHTYGFLGLTAYSVWREDLTTLADLIKRWPTTNQTAPEYVLVKAILESRTTSFRTSLESLKILLSEHPHYFRAEMWALLISLDHWKEAEQIFSTPKLQEMVKNFEKRRAQLRNGATVPTTYISIEKRLSKQRSIATAESRKQAREEAAAAQKNAEAVKPPKVKEPPKEIVVEVTKPAEISNRETVVDFSKPQVKEPKKGELVLKMRVPEKPVKKTLPKPDPELIALNKQSNKAKQSAVKLYEDGNQKQKENKVDEAISLYQSALREDPDLADVYKQLGVIYMNRQERERSLRAFKIYLQLKPESEDRQAVLGWISSMQ